MDLHGDLFKALFESTVWKHYEKALDLSIQLMAVIYNNDAWLNL